jgi:hypothetical protein
MINTQRLGCTLCLELGTRIVLGTAMAHELKREGDDADFSRLLVPGNVASNAGLQGDTGFRSAALSQQPSCKRASQYQCCVERSAKPPFN